MLCPTILFELFKGRVMRSPSSQKGNLTFVLRKGVYAFLYDRKMFIQLYGNRIKEPEKEVAAALQPTVSQVRALIVGLETFGNLYSDEPVSKSATE